MAEYTPGTKMTLDPKGKVLSKTNPKITAVDKKIPQFSPGKPSQVKTPLIGGKEGM